MRIITVLIALMFFLILSMYANMPNAMSSDELMKNMSSTEMILRNITEEKVPYTSLYSKENLTIRNAMNNIINSIIYPITTLYNTMIPITIALSYTIIGKKTSELANPIIIITIIIVIIYILSISVGLIIGILQMIYFIKEKIKSKRKIWE